MSQNSHKHPTSPQYNKLIIVLSSIFALIAFAANSVLCRMALGTNEIDPASFTQIRLLSGAIMLALLVQLNSKSPPINWSNITHNYQLKTWLAPLMLFVYAAFFSYAYIQLDTATGALILFATVQLCMLGIQFFSGQKLNILEWLGVLLSLGGFTWLMLPSASAPPLSGGLLMIIAGIAWAVYTLRGKHTNYPTLNTAENFVRCIPLCLLLFALNFNAIEISLTGTLLAVASGAIASGVGYTVWYFAVKRISITLAAISQLSVPVIAALGGVVLVGESVSMQFILAASLIILGIAIVTFSPKANK